MNFRHYDILFQLLLLGVGILIRKPLPKIEWSAKTNARVDIAMLVCVLVALVLVLIHNHHPFPDSILHAAGIGWNILMALAFCGLIYYDLRLFISSQKA